MKRKLYKKLLSEKDSKKISIIIGPRQVGKTTLLKQLHEEIGGLYLDLDILSNVEKVKSYEDFLNTLKLNGYKEKESFTVFLDEFQKYADLTGILKNLYDNNETIKIYATGSSSITIKNRIQESLAGRKYVHYLLPLDFEEFLLFKKRPINKLNKLKNFVGTLPTVEYNDLLEEFMLYGGYPEVVISSNKKEILTSIFDTFIKKDLVDYLDVREVIGIKRLIQYLAINNGNKLNISDIANKFSLDRKKIENYFEILEETFILRRIRPFFINKNKEITKSYKEYFIDSGVRNYFCNNFNSFELRNDVGFLFETFVLGEIIKSSSFEIKFWQDKKKREIDFVIDKVHETIGVEVKYKKLLKAEDYRSFIEAKKFLDKVFLVNLMTQGDDHLLPFSLNKLL